MHVKHARLSRPRDKRRPHANFSAMKHLKPKEAHDSARAPSAGGVHRLPQRDGVPLRRPPGRRASRRMERRPGLGHQPAFRRPGEQGREHEPPGAAHLPQRPALDQTPARRWSRPGSPRSTTCSRASKARSTTTITATPSPAGATRACRGSSSDRGFGPLAALFHEAESLAAPAVPPASSPCSRNCGPTDAGLLLDLHVRHGPPARAPDRGRVQGPWRGPASGDAGTVRAHLAAGVTTARPPGHRRAQPAVSLRCRIRGRRRLAIHHRSRGGVERSRARLRTWWPRAC